MDRTTADSTEKEIDEAIDKNDWMETMHHGMMDFAFEKFMRESNFIEGEKESYPKDNEGRLWKNDKIIAQRAYLMGKNKTPVTFDTLLEWHASLWKGQGILEDAGGRLRKEPVVVARGDEIIWRAPNPGMVRRLMFMFIDDLPKMDAWEAHNRFEKIHPFVDLNGRMGRLIWMYCMKRDGENPFGLTFLHQYYYQTLRHQKDVG